MKNVRFRSTFVILGFMRRLIDDSSTCSSFEEDDHSVLQIGNSVWFYADVTKTNILKLIERVHRANNYVVKYVDPYSDAYTVYVYIMSMGGDAHAGLAAMDFIRTNPVPVTTIADGMTASAGTFLLLGGKYRVARKHSIVLIHELSQTLWGKYSDLIDEMKNSTTVMDLIQRVYLDNTSVTKAELVQMLSKDTQMVSAECLANGFVHSVW